MASRRLALIVTTLLSAPSLAATSYTAEEVVKALRACVKAAYTWKSPPAPRRCENDIERILGIPSLDEFLHARGYAYTYFSKGAHGFDRESYFVGKIVERSWSDGVGVLYVRSRPHGIAEYAHFAGNSGFAGIALVERTPPLVLVNLSRIDEEAKELQRNWPHYVRGNRQCRGGLPDCNVGFCTTVNVMAGARNFSAHARQELRDATVAHEVEHAKRASKGRELESTIEGEALAMLAELHASAIALDNMHRLAKQVGAQSQIHSAAARIVLGGLVYSNEVGNPRGLCMLPDSTISEKAHLAEKLLENDFQKFSELFLSSYAAHTW